MPLPLYGHAQPLGDVAVAAGRSVFRLRSPTLEPHNPADMALVRDRGAVEAALARGFNQALVIREDAQLDGLVRDTIKRAYALPSRFDYLADGDVLGMEPTTGKFRVLYRRASAHNSFLVTERCNHYCLMCSQPPRDVADQWILGEISAALPLIDTSTKSLGFTGGEPLLDWRPFTQVLAQCRDGLPNTAVHVLSNGRAFAHSEIVEAWTAIRHPNLTVGIPIYSAVDRVHDYVVQAAGALDETVLGILKLKDRGNKVEVRVVLHAITVKRLAETGRWIGRNLPFVDHVALMGLENTGFAIANDRLLWVDPVDYRDELAEAVVALASAGVRVSIYNLPLCLLPESARPYAVPSISDWKQGYVEECDRCEEKPNCCGFFTSGRPRQSRGIRAIRNTKPSRAESQAPDQAAPLS
jgi:His-Xaa-Ser system radical SAM maturase HxsC